MNFRIPLDFNLTATLRKWPAMRQIPYPLAMTRPTIYLAVVGLAYFLSSQVSFTLGVSHILYGAAFLLLLEGGVDPSWDYFRGGGPSFQLFGSYLGLGIMIFYIGRRYYLTVLARAFGSKRGDEIGATPVWACRVLLVCVVVMCGMLIAVGLNPLLAILVVMLTGLIFLINARVHVESGVFSLQANWQAAAILLALFGYDALGPTPLIILGLFSAVIAIDPKNSLLPLVADALKFGDQKDIQPRKMAPLLGVTLLICLVVGIGATLYFQYNDTGIGHVCLSMGAEGVFELARENVQAFAMRGEQASGELSAIAPSGKFLAWAGAGLVLVIAFTLLRIRFVWWPLHPILFVTWGTLFVSIFAPSFLLGWFVKTVIVRVGGHQTYTKAKPFFVGLIAGTLAAGLLIQGTSVLYSQLADTRLPTFRIHP
jgi:hypothetical protein